MDRDLLYMFYVKKSFPNAVENAWETGNKNGYA